MNAILKTDKQVEKESNAKGLGSRLAVSGLFRNTLSGYTQEARESLRGKRGNISLFKISLFVLGVFILVGFIYLVMAAPTVGNVVLNSSSGNNLTSENLTVYTNQDSNSSVKLIYNWKKDGNSQILVNLPFDGGNNTPYAKNYGTSAGDIVSRISGWTYNATAGHDGKGAFQNTDINGRMDTATHNNLDYATGFTTNFWVYPTADGGARTIITWGDAVNGEMYQIGYDQNSGATYKLAGWGLSWFYETTVPMTINTWQMISIVQINSTTADWYKDGVYHSTYSMASPLIQSDNTARKIYFGASNYLLNPSAFLGTLDDVSVWNRTLSAEQILALYNNRTDLIVSQETEDGDVWQSCITPNDGFEDGSEVCSNNLIVLRASTLTYYGPTSYDISTAVFNDTFDVSTQDSLIHGLAFNNDGSKAYVVGDASNSIYEYDLSTNYDVSTGSFVDSFDVSAQTSLPTDVAFNDDGTKVYVVSNLLGYIYEYDLSTAFDVSTGSFVQSFWFVIRESNPTGMAFNNDGTKLYAVGSGSDGINEWILSTPYDISTATFQDIFDVSSQDTFPTGMAFNNDGSKVYVSGDASDSIYEYDLSTVFDVSTGTFVDSFSIAAQDGTPTDMVFNNDGTKLYVVGDDGDDINEYDIDPGDYLEVVANDGAINNAIPLLVHLEGGDTFQDIDTDNLLDVGSEVTIYNVPAGLTPVMTLTEGDTHVTLTFTGNAVAHENANDVADLTFVFDDTAFTGGDATIISNSGDVSAYSSNVGINFADNFFHLHYTGPNANDVSIAVFNDTLDVSAQETAPVGMVFNIDGTKMYVVGDSGNDITEYNLSIAYDVSTGTFVDIFNISAQETTPRGIALNQIGTKLYVVGDDGDDITEYNLSMPFDISTGTFVDTLNISAQETSPTGMLFDQDGIKLYVVGDDGDDITEYNLSIAYDVSTGVFVDTLDVSAQETSPTGIAFNVHGDKLYVVGSSGDDVNEYQLSTVYDVSTGVFVDTLNVSAQETEPQGVVFNGDGTKMYVVGLIGQDINEYDIDPGDYLEVVANDGAINNAIPLLVHLEGGDTFQDIDTDNLLDVGSEVTIYNVPAGLTPVMTLTEGDTHVTLTFTGNAIAHENVNDVADLTFVFDDTAFTGGDATIISGTGYGTPHSTGVGVDFFDVPTIGSVVLNSSSGTNLTSENLTAYPINSNGKLIYDWRVDGSSTTILNMPMDGGALCEGNTKICDYSNRQNVTLNSGTGEPTYNSTGGFDSMGAYYFDGGDGLYAEDAPILGTSYSFSVWVKPETFSWDRIIYGDPPGDDNAYQLLLNDDDGSNNIYLWTKASGSSLKTRATTALVADQWYHIVATIDGADIRVYINGNASGVVISASSADVWADDDINLHIGKKDDSNGYFRGYIDEVKVWNRALSSEQAFALYDNRTDLIVSQETRGGENWSVQVTPIYEEEMGASVSSGDLSVLPPSIDSIVLNSSLGENTTIENLTAYVSPLDSPQRYVYNWRVDDESFALVHLPFDYGTSTSSVIDFTSYNHSIVLEGDSAPYYPRFNSTFGAIGGSVRFDGSTGDERVTIITESTSVPLQSLMDNVTVSMWVYIDTLTETYFYQEWDSDTRRYQVGFLANGTFQLYDDIDNNEHTFYGNFTFVNNTWYHVVVVGSGRNWKGYVNGDLILDVDSGDGIVDMNEPRHSRHYFGARRLDDDWGYELQGSMDEVMIFNRSLSGEQIGQLYNEQSGSVNTSTIVYEETVVGENWSVQVTPIYEAEMGASVLSNNLTILNFPIITSLVLNASSLNNYSTEDLTAWASIVPSEVGGTRVIYDWRLENNSFKRLHMPFDLESSSTWTKDYSGYGNNGTINSGITYNATGGYDGGGAYEFAGVNDGLTLTDDSSVALTGDMTFMAWGKYNVLAGDMNLVAYSSDGEFSTYNYLYQLELGIDKKLRYLHEYIAGSNEPATSTVVADVGVDEWHHYGFVRDSALKTIRFYVDGEQLGDVRSYVNSPDGGASSSFYIGQDYDVEHWNGAIDEVVILDKVLTGWQILNYYNNESNILDFSMTSAGENWSICGIPTNNEFGEEGLEVCSDVLIVLEDLLVIENISVIDGHGHVISFIDDHGEMSNNYEEIIRGTNATFNVTITNATEIDSVWIKIWENVIGGVVKFVGYLANIVGDVWTIAVPADSTFNESEYNYTIYVNTTGGLEENVSSVFDVADVSLDEVVLNTTSEYNLSSDPLTAHLINLIPADADLTYNWFLNGLRYPTNPSTAFDDKLKLSFENYSAVKDMNSDISGNGNDVVSVSGATWGSAGGHNGSAGYSFDGTNDYLIISDDDSLDVGSGEDFSIALWVNRGASSSETLLDKYTGASVGYRLYFGANLGFYVTDSGGTQTLWDNAPTVIAINDWTHVVVMRDGSTLKMYLDGVLDESAATARTGSLANSLDVWVGENISGGSSFEGSLSELMFFKKALSDDEVVQLYNGTRRDVIDPYETLSGETWSVNVTTRCISEVGPNVMSNNITLDEAYQFAINYPLDYASYIDNVTSINYTIDVTGSCWYSINGGAGSTPVNAGTAFGINLGFGDYNLTVSCNDTRGVVVQKDITFFVKRYDGADEVQKLLASDSQAGDNFGNAVDVSGDYAIVGAQNEDTDGSAAGAAYIYKKNSSGDFEIVGKIQADDKQASDYFGYSVSIDESYAIVGAYGEDGAGSNRGAVYVFEKNSSGNFNQIQKLVASEPADNDTFGSGVALDGDYVVIGSRYNDDVASDAGVVYVFKLSIETGRFVEYQKLFASDAQANDYFGDSVDVSGGQIIVGAYGEDGAGTDRGAAYIFRLNSSLQFVEVNKFSASDAGDGNQFGYSVSISGDYAVAGAPFEDTGVSNAGAVYIFVKNSTGQFEEVNMVQASDAEEDDGFGKSVSISGDYVIVGAYEKNSSTGAAYVLNKNSTSGEFEELIKILASDNESGDNFGYAVSVSGDQVIVGAPGEDDGGNESGAAYVFELSYQDLISPAVFDLRPVQNTTYNISDVIEIGVNVTDDVAVDAVLTNVTMPNGTVQLLTLTNVSSWYNNSFTIPALIGQYNVTFVANDSSGNLNVTEITFFVGMDSANPAVFDLRPVSDVTYNVSTAIEVGANVTDSIGVDSVLANVTMPNGTVQQLTLTNVSSWYNNSFTIPALIGQYNVTFIANDSSGNLNVSETTFFVGQDLEIPQIEFANLTTIEGNYSQVYIDVNVTVSDNVEVDVITINLYNSSSVLINSTTSNVSPFSCQFVDLNDGIYYLNATVNDSSGNVNSTETRIIILDATPPAVFDLRPVSNVTYNVSDAIEIGANVTDRVGVDVVLVNVTWPNGTVEQLVLSNKNSWYNNSFTIPAMIGQYNVTFVANDSLNNLNVTETTFFVGQDVIPPVLNITSPANHTQISDATPEVSFNITDNVPLGITYQIYIDGSLASHSGSGMATSGTITTVTILSAMSLGNHNVTVEAHDGSSNAVNQTINISIVPPVVYLMSPSYNATLTIDNITFIFNVSDPSYSNLSCSLYINDILNQTNGTTLANTTTNFSVVGLGEEVDQNWSVNCTNGAGVSAVDTWLFGVDMSAPAVFDLRPVENVTYNVSDTIEIGANVTDGVGVDVVLANVTMPDNTTTQLILTNTGSWYNSSYTIPAIIGQYNVTFIANDTLGAVNSTETTFFVGQDLEIPQIEFANLTTIEGNYSQVYIDVNVTVSDNVEVDVITINLYNATGLVSSQMSTSSPFNYTLSGLADATYYLNATVNDSSDNVNSTETRIIILDVTPPAVFDLRPVSNMTYNVSTTVEVAANVTDDLVIDSVFVNVTMPNGTVVSLELLDVSGGWYNNSFTIPAMIGQYNVTFVANDSFGAVNVTETTFFVGVDSVNPGVEFVNLTTVSGNYSQDYIDANVTAGDNVEVDVIAINLYNATGLVSSQISTSSPFDYTFSSLADGTYYLNATVNDSSNNVNSTETRIIVLDVSVPVVSLVVPSNSTKTNVNNVTFSCNATNTELSNLTLYVWDSAAEYYVNTTSVSGTENESAWDLTNIPDGNYEWNCLAVDNVNLVGWAEDNWTLGVDTVEPWLNITSPLNASLLSDPTPEIRFNVSDALSELLNYVIWLNGTSGTFVYGGTVVNGTELGKTVTANLDLGNYTFYVNVTDEYGNVNTSLIYEFETVPPVVYLLSPEFNQSLNIENVSFKFNVTDPSFSSLNCSLYIDGSLNYTNATTLSDVNTTINVSGMSGGNHEWMVVCNNTVVVVNNSALFIVDVSDPVVSLVSPADATATNNKNVSFVCNATDFDLVNITLYVWNSTSGVEYYANTTNVSGESAVVGWNLTMDYGDYDWNCRAVDFVVNVGWAVSNYSLSVRNITDEIILSDLGCSDDSAVSWKACNFSYGEEITHMRVRAELDIGNISLVRFDLFNVDDDEHYVDNLSSTYNESDYYVLNSSYDLVDSGNWSLTVYGIEEDGNVSVENVRWYIDYGFVSIALIDPVVNGDVVYHGLFDFEVNVSCFYGECGRVNVTLDPEVAGCRLQVAGSRLQVAGDLCNEVVTCENVSVWEECVFESEVQSPKSEALGHKSKVQSPKSKEDLGNEVVACENVTVSCVPECEEVCVKEGNDALVEEGNGDVWSNNSEEGVGDNGAGGSLATNYTNQTGGNETSLDKDQTGQANQTGQAVENVSVVCDNVTVEKCVESNDSVVNETAVENVTEEGNEGVENVTEEEAAFAIQSGYVGGNHTVGETSFLVVWDENDVGMPNAVGDAASSKKINEDVTFYASYKISLNGSVIADGSCSVLINGTGEVMSYSAPYYSFTKNMTESGEFSYTVNCNHSGYDNLSVMDLVVVEESSDNTKGAISMVEGAVPFYTVDDNPTNCTLRGGETCNLNWRVNATGAVGKSYTFFVEVNGGRVSYNRSDEINLTISRTDSTDPVIVWRGATPSAIFNGSSTVINANVEDNVQVDSVWGIVTHPISGFNTSFTTLPYNFTNTTEAGRYNVTFIANDSSGNNVTATTWFEVAEALNTTINVSVEVDVSLNVSNNFTFKLVHPDFGDTILEVETNGTFSAQVPNVVYDIMFLSAFNETMDLILRRVNLSANQNESISLDKHRGESGYLVTYGVNTDYAFDVSEVVFSYIGETYTTEGNLQLWKCDSYDFDGRSCLGGWADITSSATQNISGDYFEYVTYNFSGFSIREYVAPSEEEEVVRGGGSGGRCADGYERVEDRCALIQNESGVTGDREQAAGEGGIPEELFDIKFTLEDTLIQGVDGLSGVVTFESFGTVPTFVNLTFSILDENGDEVYSAFSNITVTTEEVLRWNYDGLGFLPDGKYTAIFTSLYNVDVFDEFVQEFEVGEERSFFSAITGNVVGFLSGGYTWWIVPFVFLLLGLLWFVLGRRKRGRAKVIRESFRQTGTANTKLDRKRKALAPGKRVSKDGNVYYEHRRSGSDIGGKLSTNMPGGRGYGGRKRK